MHSLMEWRALFEMAVLPLATPLLMTAPHGDGHPVLLLPGFMADEATLFALQHADEYARQAALLRAERQRLQAALARLPGVRAFPSEANMILVRVPDGARAFEGMKARGVLVKHIAGLHPLLAHCLRLTVGSPEENDAMIQALEASL